MRFPVPMLVFAAMSVAATAASPKESVKNSAGNTTVQKGVASWYGNEFKGHKMANGQRYNPEEFTAAHRKLPFGTLVRVTNLRNNRSVVVRITNRGPYVKGRIIDVSRAAARELGMIISGTARVQVETVSERVALQAPPVK